MAEQSLLPAFDSSAQYKGLQYDYTKDILKVSTSSTAYADLQAGGSAQQLENTLSGTGAILAQNFNLQQSVTTDLAGPATGVALGTPIYLRKGVTYTNFVFLPGSTGTASPTHWACGLYDTSATPALVAHTADQTTTAIVANTVTSTAFTAAYTPTVSGWYIAAFTETSSGQCTLEGKAPRVAAVAAGITGSTPISQTSGSALAGVFAATWASPSAALKIPWVALT